MKHHLLCAVLCILLGPTAVALAQSQADKAATGETKPPTPTQRALPTKGEITHGTYKNPSIGLEFTPAEGLHLQDPEIKGTPGTTPLLVTVQALDERGGLLGLSSARRAMIFYADALTYYPEDQRSATRYLRKIVRTNANNGFEQVGGDRAEQMGGNAFVRADFAKGALDQTVLLAVHDGYAFVFIFASYDLDATKELIAATKVKITDIGN